MDKPKVFVTRVIPDAGLNRIKEFCEAEVWPDELPPSYETLLEKAKGREGLLTLLTDRIDARLMDTAGPQLKVISQYAVGFDNIDIAAATERGIPVGNTPGVLTDATADFAWTLLMAAARRVVEGAEYVKAGRWKTWGPTLLRGYDVAGATLGVVGFGRIGKGVARRATGFNMRILYYDPYCQNDPYAAEIGAECVDFETLLVKSDFISLHTPLTPETRHLLNADAFRKMKKTAILINTSRGPVVDPEALYQALKEGEIAYAALDVTEPEPIPMDSPLLTLQNCLIVPHMASATYTARDVMATIAADNLIAGLKGERLRHCVNPEVYGDSDQ